MTPGSLEVQDSCYFWLLLLGSAAGGGEGSVLRAGRTPHPTLEVEVIGWICFWLGRHLSLLPFQRGMEGGAADSPPCPRERSQLRFSL